MSGDIVTAYVAAAVAGNAKEVDRLGELLDVADQLDRVHEARPTALADAARRYAAAGIAVFPCQPRGKAPLTRNGLNDATTKALTVGAWWAEHPNANIGLRTGLRYDVVDVDGLAGMESLFAHGLAFYREIEPDLVAVAVTPRPGGLHLYVYATGHGNKTAMHAGIDYRGKGGYVIAPPSVGATGRRYAFTRTLAGVVL